MFGEKKATDVEQAAAENQEGAEQAASPRKYKIDGETANNEFIRYCENNDIDFDESKMTEEEKESFSDIKRRFIKCCMEGRVEVDGKSVKYTVSGFSEKGFSGEIITIQRPNGNAFSAMDSFKDRENVHKLHGFMSAMTGKDLGYFSKIDISDWKFFNAISSLFLSL
jgi:hypothetical protein